MRVPVLAAVALCLIACGARQSTERRDEGLYGRVIDTITAGPLPGVTVDAGGAGRTAASNGEGFYFIGLPPGTYEILFVYGYLETRVTGVRVTEEERRPSVCVFMNTDGPEAKTMIPWSETMCLVDPKLGSSCSRSCFRDGKRDEACFSACIGSRIEVSVPAEPGDRDAQGEIAGTVVDLSTGKPVAVTVEVQAQEAYASMQRLRTDEATGAFQAKGLGPGTYQVTVSPIGGDLVQHGVPVRGGLTTRVTIFVGIGTYRGGDSSHAAHEHAHEHPHEPGDHHHHDHAHPHEPGDRKHHHSH